MKKLFILAVVLLFATGTALAEGETFKIGGAYRMEMYDFEDADHDSDLDDHQQFYDQRFRIQMDFMPAEGVKTVFRADFAEDTWGEVGADGGIGYEYRKAVEINKAYADLQVAMVNLKLGLFGQGGLGNSINFEYQGTNVIAAASFEPVAVKVLYSRLSEGAALTDELDDDSDLDTDLMGVEVKYAADAFSVGGYYGTLIDEAAEDTKNAVGLFGAYGMGKLSFWGEVAMYSGSNDADEVDYVGTSVALNGEMAVSDQLTAGVDVTYAPGDTDDDKDQISDILDDWGYVPLDHGPFKWVKTTGINVFEIEDDAGANMINVYGTYAAMEALTIYANVGYVAAVEEDPDDDDVFVSNYTVMSVGGTYAFLPNTALSLKYQNISISGDEIADDPTQNLMGMVSVSF
jgi:hypothetical protein